MGLEAVFSVTSPTKGNDACLYGPGTDQADSVLDATASRDTIDRYIWTSSCPTLGRASVHAAAR